MVRSRVVIAVAALLLVAGCAGHQRRDDLNTTLKAYHSTLRWDGFARARDFISPKWRDAHELTPLQQARYQQVRVVGYDEGGGPTRVADNEVRQTVRIDLVNRHTMAERSVIDHQVWKWDAQAKRWWLTTGLPDITRQRPPE